MLNNRRRTLSNLGEMDMGLRKYRKKRNFSKTPEPPGTPGVQSGQYFVVQKHQASHLHYDFRLQVGDVLKSWAIPKGPSINPSHKRLAIQVEDHPIEYRNFEGTIPSGEYGAGIVMVWDFGIYEPLGGQDLQKSIQEGRIRFRLEGKKLKGGFILIKTKYQANRNSWLLIKENDTFARKGYDITKEQVKSAKTGLTLKEIRQL
jgi:bifunctional non-homologous end joining protein LigD